MNYTLNRHRSPIGSCIVNRQFWVKKLLRAVLREPLCTGHVTMRMRSELCSVHNRINATFCEITWLNLRSALKVTDFKNEKGDIAQQYFDTYLDPLGNVLLRNIIFYIFCF